MKFGGISKSSTIDFPGVLSCVLFTVGCNLDCFYCHNRELIKDGPEMISEKSVMDFLNARKGLLDGVVISGGEPTLQSDLANFCLTLKEMGYKIKLDTNGFRPNVVAHLMDKNLIDYFAVDYKAASFDYEKICGANSIKVHETIKILLNSKADFEVRTTLYPSLSLENLKILLSQVPKVPRYRINFYKKPILFEFKHLDLLEQDFLTVSDIKDNFDELLKIQPNLVEV